MAAVDGEFPLFGDVEIDETFVGGKHHGTRGRGAKGKTMVFGMLQRNGEVMTKVVPNAKRKTLLPIIQENVTKGSTCHTDELTTYRTLDKNGYEHQSVNHGAKEYQRVNPDGSITHTNSLENFWKHLKGGINGTHIHVSKKHLGKYAKEFEFRFNHRANPLEMFPALVSTYQKP